MSASLADLLLDVPDVRSVGALDLTLAGMTCDSRQVRPGYLFAALPGVKADGSAYVAQALEQGAAALLVASEIQDAPVPQIVAARPREAFARLTAAFYGNPSRRMDLIGITGTNGKTTIAYGLRHVLREAGRRTGMLGTIEYDNGTKAEAAPLTTPAPEVFSHQLAEMVENGCEAAAVEVSSHALAQDRVAGHRFACGVFTNLTRDHLDYHGSMQDYLAAKKRLFDGLDQDACAVVNADDPHARELLADCRAQRLLYGFGPGADLRATVERETVEGTRLTLRWDDRTGVLETPLVGRYNGLNCLAIVGAALAIGVEAGQVLDALRTFHGAPGRLERLAAPDRPTVFVDYAHTDDALRSALAALRPLTRGRLVVVFGCGGDRDRGKRPLMAQAAEQGADAVIVTSDNPRTESPDGIFADIRAGFSRPEQVREIPGRAEAIEAAIAAGGADDVVLVAGKGHEDYQIVGTERRPLDDRRLVRRALGL